LSARLESTYPARSEPDRGYAASPKPPLKRDGAGYRSGSKPPLPGSRAPRWHEGDGRKTLESPRNRRFRRCTGRL